MKHKNIKFITAFIIFALSFGQTGYAIGSSQNPQSGSMGLEATIPSPPPSQGATIAIPGSGQSFTNLPITVSGLCPSNLLVKILANNIFVGSAQCNNGSYNLKIDLFNGRNDLSAQDYDNLGQAGPASAPVSVNFQDSQTIHSGQQITLTSSYAELGANPGSELDWPVVISGGTPPYAISTDWGDGQPSKLQTSSFQGKVILKHTYNSSGVYEVTVTATDSNGLTAFLQLVGVGNGQIKAAATTSGPKLTTASANNSNNTVPWWVFGVLLVTLLIAFWLGTNHGRKVLIKKYNK